MKLKGKKTVLAGFRKEGVEARIYILIRKAWFSVNAYFQLQLLTMHANIFHYC